MYTVMIIFIIVAVIFALATLAYVAIDYITERRQIKEEREREYREEATQEGADF